MADGQGMRITLENVAKKFAREKVFSGAIHVFEPGSRTALLGPNGSGKSTLLQVVAGALVPTAGSVEHRLAGRLIDPEQVYRHVSIAAPYLNLYEDLSLRQALANHARFKPFHPGISVQDVAKTAYLEPHLERPVLHFSSGMKQRLKLALAILSNTPLLLLDEPATNLDAEGIAWFRELLMENLDGRTLLVASNRQEEETFACTESLVISKWK
ncbi:MAG TPA: ABC transporter ATP-binding protein [Flavobacteriales bacterium]|mgnify:FL=1|nr:ABC transporter ATP-binding protein [Flavobacteriales bacterium]